MIQTLKARLGDLRVEGSGPAMYLVARRELPRALLSLDGFRQLAVVANMPDARAVAFLADLPTTLAAQNLNYGLSRSGADADVQIVVVEGHGIVDFRLSEPSNQQKMLRRYFRDQRTLRQRDQDSNAKRRRLDSRNLAERLLRRQLRAEVAQAYGGQCACCGESVLEFLGIDHVNGGGRQERKQLGSDGVLRRIVALGFPPEYQLLCHNCNQARAVFGICPHQTDRPVVMSPLAS